jgi:Flp pilus assembly CpaF family ATPase
VRLLIIPVEPGASAQGRKYGVPMGAEPIRIEAMQRSTRMLRTAMGGAIAEWLADPRVIEIMLNPDGRLWVDRLGQGIAAPKAARR